MSSLHSHISIFEVLQYGKRTQSHVTGSSTVNKNCMYSKYRGKLISVCSHPAEGLLNHKVINCAIWYSTVDKAEKHTERDIFRLF